MPSNDVLCLGSPLWVPPGKPETRLDPSTDVQWRHLLSSDPAKAFADLAGDFAIAVADDRGRLHLAVDRFAAQTLCHALVDGQLRFAERADQLAGPGTRIALQSIFQYLFLHAIASPRTVFEGVARLPAGHHAVFDGGALTIRPYWTPTFAELTQPSFSSLRDEFRALLQRAVERQLLSGPPACYLSGGTDSSTVAGMIRQATGQGAQAYSIGFEAEGYDEMSYARLAAKHFGARHHEYYVTPNDLVQTIGQVATHFDQPFGNSSAVPAFHCALQARQDGVTRLMAGDGGDELFGGNARYATQRVLGIYDAVPGVLRHGVLEPVFGNAVARRVPLVRKVSSYIEQARAPLPDRMQMYNLLRLLGFDRVLAPGFLQAVDLQALSRQQREVWNAVGGTPSVLNRTLAFDWRYTLAENDLPKVRESARLAGVAVGFPLLDKDLLAFSLRLPTDYKLKGLRLRWFFKEALRDFLPVEIIEKKKHGFGLPFGVWMLKNPALQQLATDSVRSFATRGIVRPDFIDELLGTLLPQHPGYYGELVWVLMMLEQWLRVHAPNFSLANGAADSQPT